MKILLTIFILGLCAQSCAASQKRERPIAPTFPKLASLDIEKYPHLKDFSEQEKALYLAYVCQMNHRKCMEYYGLLEEYRKKLAIYIATGCKL